MMLTKNAIRILIYLLIANALLFSYMAGKMTGSWQVVEKCRASE